MKDERLEIKDRKLKVKTKPKKATPLRTTKASKIKQVLEVSVAKSTDKKATSGGLKVDVYDMKGKVIETMDLPKEIFGLKANDALVSQAVRVYLANHRRGTVSTKTRGEVAGSTRKIYRQKGTGRARHGSLRAPIFVHGGIVFGPKPRDFSLNLSKKMSRRALFTVLSEKLKEKRIKILGDIEKISPKTKEGNGVFDKLGFISKKKKVLFVAPSSLRKEFKNIYRAINNLSGVSILEARMLNAYDVLNNKEIVFMKKAVDVISDTFLKGKE